MLAFERLLFLAREGKVGYRWGREGAEQEPMDYLEFIARMTSHIPDKGQLTVIDRAAPPAIYYRHGLAGGFSAERGNSARSEKANSYLFNLKNIGRIS